MHALSETRDVPQVLALGELMLDVGRYNAAFAGRSLELSRSEHELLTLLVTNSHRVMSRGELADHLALERARSVDVLLTKLRRVLGRDFVRNVRGRGWIVISEALEE